MRIERQELETTKCMDLFHYLNELDLFDYEVLLSDAN